MLTPMVAICMVSHVLLICSVAYQRQELSIRFATSHPKDLNDDVINAFGELDNLMPALHLPVQSGSNAILKAMHRRYTREHYLEIIKKLREVRPDIALSTDIIVGFPGETRRLPANLRPY